VGLSLSIIQVSYP